MNNPIALPVPYKKLVNSISPNGDDVRIPIRGFKLKLVQVLKLSGDQWIPVARDLQGFGVLNVPKHRRWIEIHPPKNVV